MAYNQNFFMQQADYTDEEFYGIIQRLKELKALPEDCFVRDIPFFTFDSISKESQIKELFNTSDPEFLLYKALFQNILNNQNHAEESFKPPVGHIMTFAQICLYKILPCPDRNCSKRPREIVTHNQYKDHEYECPFYHHDRDRRRVVLSTTADEDFAYKANYYEEGRSSAEKDKYSHNYFESMFQPLYYKMFRCKREYCANSDFCPFYHHEQEKKTWDKVFSNFIHKDRITYVKDKQKYYESTSNHTNDKESFSNGDSPNKLAGSSYHDDRRNQRNNKYPKSPPTPGSQNYNPNYQAQGERRQDKNRQFNNKKFIELNRNPDNRRKNFGDAYGTNTLGNGVFDVNRQYVPYRAN